MLQLSTDGLKAYADSVGLSFGANIDYAEVHKKYGHTRDNGRYSPAVCLSTEEKVISGSPDHSHISTSYVERQNLTMRMCLRRFTRLTNGFSKKIEKPCHALALHYMYYNFCRIHKTLRVTPAMKADLSEDIWAIADLVKLLN